jgi:hypothetical protein
MADKKISALTAATTPLAGTEVLPIVQSSSTVKVSVANLTAGRTVDATSYTATGSAYFGAATALSGAAELGLGNGASSATAFINVNSSGNSQVRLNIAGTFKGGFYTTGTGMVVASSDVLNFSTDGGATNAISVNTSSNLVIGTAAKGIDFSANPSAAGMTSELLNDYEEGTWTPTDASGAGLVITITAATTPTYVKIGRLVVCSADVTYPVTANASTARLSLPFAGAAASPAGGGMVGFKSDGISVFGSVGTTGSTFLSPVNTFLTNANLSGVRFQMTWTFQV